MADRALEALASHGQTWTDHVLLMDSNPPSIFLVSEDGLSLLHIEDAELASAYLAILVERGVRRFDSFAEFVRVVRPPEVAIPRAVDDER